MTNDCHLLLSLSLPKPSKTSQYSLLALAGQTQYKADRADPRYESEAGICANALGTYHMLRAARIAGNFIAIATFTTCVKGLTGGKTFYGFSRDFYANYLQLTVLSWKTQEPCLT